MDGTSSRQTIIRLILVALGAIAVAVGILATIGVFPPSGTLASSLQVVATIALVWITLTYVERVEQQAEATDLSVNMLVQEKREAILYTLAETRDELRNLRQPVSSQLSYAEEESQTLGHHGDDPLLGREAVESMCEKAGSVGGRVYTLANEAAESFRAVNEKRAARHNASYSEPSTVAYAEALREAKERSDVCIEALEEEMEALREIDFLGQLKDAQRE